MPRILANFFKKAQNGKGSQGFFYIINKRNFKEVSKLQNKLTGYFKKIIFSLIFPAFKKGHVVVM